MSISVEKLYELYIDTVSRIGVFLLKADDETLGYEIFEEFDGNVTIFCHENTLKKLFANSIISEEKMKKSLKLRELAFEIQANNEWKLEDVRKSKRWRELFELEDEINSIT